MQTWTQEEGNEFKNSDICYGREYKPDGTDKIDIAQITIKGDFPSANGWGWLEKSDEMAVVIAGKGFVVSEKDGRKDLKVGDVVYVPAGEKFRWGGDMEMIIPCGPAFDPKFHKIENA